MELIAEIIQTRMVTNCILDLENKMDLGVSSWILICLELEEFPCY